jgi:hypothetical protein
VIKFSVVFDGNNIIICLPTNNGMENIKKIRSSVQNINISNKIIIIGIIIMLFYMKFDVFLAANINTVIPRLTKIIRSGITFVSRNLR